MKPRNSIRRPSSVYITPMRLWSTLVIHSRHRYGTCPATTSQATTARTMMSTPAPAPSGIGWSHGIASQVSFPSISVLRFRFRTNLRRAGFGGRARSRRDLLRHDRREQARLDRAVREWTDTLARLRERRVAGAIQRGAGAPCARDPGIEFVPWNGAQHEMHGGKAVAA